MDARVAYLDLLQDCLLGLIYQDPPFDPWSGVVKGESPVIEIHEGRFDAQKRRHGLDWPMTAHSMIGELRMKNLRQVCEFVLTQGVPGDFIETGVWRGGACIMMAGIMKAYAYDDTQRKIWVADSFEGLPKGIGGEISDFHHRYNPILAVSLEAVQENFKRYMLLDDRVKFLKGWFKDTLPSAPIEKLAVLRLDGDMYESTSCALQNLYPKLSPGGFVVIDDYHAVKGCAGAVEDYRLGHNITTPIQAIDGVGAYWQKE